jgi:MFS family permease
MAPGSLQCLLCAAGVGCCIAMAMPQTHIVAYASDLGYLAARGAEMLALMLATGIVSRLGFGWISDRIGGLKTLLLGSALQALTLSLFLAVDGLVGLYLISALFGLSQGGIVPSYAIIIATFFRSSEAGWRIGLVLFSTLVGMGVGAWLAGLLYDLTGSYDAAFLNAIAFNLVNTAIAAGLLRRARRLALA